MHGVTNKRNTMSKDNVGKFVLVGDVGDLQLEALDLPGRGLLLILSDGNGATTMEHIDGKCVNDLKPIEVVIQGEEDSVDVYGIPVGIAGTILVVDGAMKYVPGLRLVGSEALLA